MPLGKEKLNPYAGGFSEFASLNKENRPVINLMLCTMIATKNMHSNLYSLRGYIPFYSTSSPPPPQKKKLEVILAKLFDEIMVVRNSTEYKCSHITVQVGKLGDH